MLSVRKIKLHGMQDTRWGHQNKITQYKGLINLFLRDRDIMQWDTNVVERQQKDNIRWLVKDSTLDREKLDNAIQGDKQQIRNVLGEHKHLQLAYQDLPPRETIDQITQQNFILRKKLDRLTDKMRRRTEVLIQEKLQLAEMQDRLRYGMSEVSPLEIEIKIITDKVRNTVLNHNAAICVRNTYQKILLIMKKDAMSFDAVLDALNLDTKLQGKCMFRAVHMGQLATEYLDDRKVELLKLQHMVRDDMANRSRDLKLMTEEVDQTFVNFRFNMRKDSDVTLALADHNTNLDVQEDIETISETLNKLNDSFHVTSYYVLNDRLHEQHQETERLAEFGRRCINGKDVLENKMNRATLMYDTLYYTVVETTFEYMKQKRFLKKQIQIQIEKINVHRQKLTVLSALMVKVKSALQHLEQNCKVVKEPHLLKKAKGKQNIPPQEMSDYIDIKTNGLEIINLLSSKLAVLSANEVAFPSEYVRELTKIKMQKLIARRCKAISIAEVKDVSPSITEVIIEDILIPTRAEIKMKSKHILIAYSKQNADLIGKDR